VGQGQEPGDLGLAADQVADYQAWFENRKRLRDLTHQLEALCMDMVGDDERTPTRKKRASAG
jgi:hypothetical protein